MLSLHRLGIAQTRHYGIEDHIYRLMEYLLTACIFLLQKSARRKKCICALILVTALIVVVLIIVIPIVVKSKKS